nr:hypothetical protein [Tanacetum cinerariifolium]GFB52366.1 hypothetical protein [Tanacetum cinerariifolium]GFB52385.1 hypothetical protein [Tanacetum cinerariifolium]
MLTNKWHTLNHNYQKFNAIFKRCKCLGKGRENDLDVTKCARSTYGEENKEKLFAQEDALGILKSHSKWDVPELFFPGEPVDLTGGEQVLWGDHEELFREDLRSRPPAKPVLQKNANSRP